MLEGFDILYFSADDWGCGLTTSQTHIAKILAQKNRVLYINSLGLRKPQVSPGDVNRICSKIKKFFRGIQEEAKNLWVFTPIVIPYHDSKIVQKINCYLLIRFLRYHLKKFSMKKPIFWSFLPNAVYLIGKFNEQKVIYYCVDEYSEFDGVPAQAIRRQEQNMIHRADFVFASAQTLFERKKNGNQNTYYIPHGVDFGHFKRALDPDLEIPSDIRHIPAPIIGFYGLIESWIDVELIIFLAQSRPEWSFVLIGECKIDLAQFCEFKNIHLIGKRRYEDLPAYNKAFNVAIIPFLINQLTKNVNPLKFKEYLAAGSPVVSTAIPEIKKYQELIYLANNKQEFLEKIELALKENGPLPVEERLAFVKNKSWRNRLEYISEIILNGSSNVNDFEKKEQLRTGFSF